MSDERMQECSPRGICRGKGVLHRTQNRVPFGSSAGSSSWAHRSSHDRTSSWIKNQDAVCIHMQSLCRLSVVTNKYCNRRMLPNTTTNTTTTRCLARGLVVMRRHYYTHSSRRAKVFLPAITIHTNNNRNNNNNPFLRQQQVAYPHHPPYPLVWHPSALVAAAPPALLHRHLFSTTTTNKSTPTSTFPTTPSTPLHDGGSDGGDDDDIPLPAPPVDNEDFSQMTNEQLADTSTITGWHLVHSPPRKFPRGALVGTVVSDKMQKTVNVAVDRYRIVPKIRKRIKYTRKFMAHDEQEVARMGDVVMITPCHRLSKHKHFLLREIIRSKGQLS